VSQVGPGRGFGAARDEEEDLNSNGLVVCIKTWDDWWRRAGIRASSAGKCKVRVQGTSSRRGVGSRATAKEEFKKTRPRSSSKGNANKESEGKGSQVQRMGKATGEMHGVS
jgi:hypothetical protein